LVRADVANAIVSRDAAREVYGVVFGRDLQVDRAATQQLREAMRQQKSQARN
jgi:hypothetical protein